jgi:hypothetical protein
MMVFQDPLLGSLSPDGNRAWRGFLRHAFERSHSQPFGAPWTARALRHSHLWLKGRVSERLEHYLAASERSDTAPAPPRLGASRAFQIYPAFGRSRYKSVALPSGPRYLKGETDDQGKRTCRVLARWARACVRGAWPSRKTMHGGGAACQRRVPGLIGRL